MVSNYSHNFNPYHIFFIILLKFYHGYNLSVTIIIVTWYVFAWQRKNFGINSR